MGSVYLIGVARATIDAVAPVWKIGSYLWHCRTASLLTRSPLISIIEGKKTKVYVNAYGLRRPLCCGQRNH
jgi:hypothetical protein